MGPMEPDAAGNAQGQDSEATHAGDSAASSAGLARTPSVERLPTASVIVPEEPIRLAIVPHWSGEEPVMATVVESPATPTADRAATPLVGGSGWAPRPGLPWNAQTDLPVDPVVMVAYYAKALFSPEAQEALFGGRPLDKVYSVPRRFDLATLFVVSTLFAMLFTVLAYFEFSSSAKLAWCLFFSGVGFAQAALYNGRAPRLASALAGSILLVLLFAPLSLASWRGALCSSPALLVVGVPCGYIAGTLIGGVFLVADKLRDRIAEHRATRRLKLDA